MTKKLLLVSMLFLINVVVFAQHLEKGRQIMIQKEEINQINTLQSDVNIVNYSRNGKAQQRVLQQYIKRKSATKQNIYEQLLVYTSPADVKGTGILTWEYESQSDDQWLFLPALRKARRIAASNKKDRFVGTELTFEDISNYLSEDLANYRYEFLRMETKNGHNCYVIEATPIDAQLQKTTAYRKRILWISEDKKQLIFIEFYNSKNTLFKTLSANNIQAIGNSGQFRPLQVIVENLQTKNRTEINFQNMRINSPIEAYYFTKRHLESF